MRLKLGSMLNTLLEGGLEKDIITSIYGPSGSGKSCLAMISALNVSGNGQKVIYVDTECGFSPERCLQLKGCSAENLQRIMVLKLTSFTEQARFFDNLKSIISKNVGLIVVDSVAMLYRFALNPDNVQKVNKSLGLQLSSLIEIARMRHIPSLITSHVYSDFDNHENVKVVGGDLLRYCCKCLIELRKLKGSNRDAIIRKHRNLPEGKSVRFTITNEGVPMHLTPQ